MSIQSANLNSNGLIHNQTVSTESITSMSSAQVAPVPQSSVELMHKEKFELSISEEALVKAIERANKTLAGIPTHVQYSIHKPSGDILVKVINTETKEVIREIPPEKLLDLIDKLQELNGRIIDEKR
ncbi:flagellar protein FlaG [Paenibacillus elgii]|uniref:flagellar protein FlaG n=1 Tax=Paenibacillus elgii TaxID=189691 RepID=UPI000FD6E4F7|nr:flagellar protein FlaG [Paenibacillus elgii]NEN85104.1 flagellar protein FlaG [Paenibacillus elgii]